MLSKNLPELKQGQLKKKVYLPVQKIELPITPRKLERYQTTKEMLINSERPFCCNAFHISPEAHCGCRSNKLRPSIKISAWRSYDLFNLYSIRAIFIKYRSFLCDVPIFKMAKLFYCFFPLFMGNMQLYCTN